MTAFRAAHGIRAEGRLFSYRFSQLNRRDGFPFTPHHFLFETGHSPALKFDRCEGELTFVKSALRALRA